MERRLYRSEDDRMIAGVCGGLAEYVDIDPVLVRLAFALLIFAGGIGFIAYIVLWIIMPTRARVGAPAGVVVRENVEDMGERARELGEEVRAAFEGEPGEEGELAPHRRERRPAYLVGGLLIILGLIFLVDSLRIFPWWTFGRLWPLILIFIGLALLMRRR